MNTVKHIRNGFQLYGDFTYRDIYALYWAIKWQLVIRERPIPQAVRAAVYN